MERLERVINAMTHKPVDRTPKFDYVLQDPSASYVLGRPYISIEGRREEWKRLAKEVGYGNALERYVEERLEIVEKLGHDLVCLSRPPVLEEPVAEGNSVQYEDPEDRLKARNEAVCRELDKPFNDYGMDIYECMQHKTEYSLPIFAPAYTQGVWDDTDLMETMVTEPEIAKEHFRLCGEQAIRLARAYVERGVQIIGIGGDFCGNRPIISPASYRELIVPQVRRVSDAIHEMGAFTVNASDGNLWDVADDFLLGCKVDAYMEIDSRAGMELKRLKDRYGEKICFMGNIDCGALMSFAAPEEIRKAVFQCLQDGGATGHIFTPSNAITATVPVENFRAMHDAYCDYFGVPRIKW